MNITVQQTIDAYLDAYHNGSRELTVAIEQAEECFELFSEYLLHFSDLFQEQEEFDESTMAEWEAALEQYVEKLFEHDTEQVPDLGPLPLSVLEAEHLRDFLGWFLLRLPGIDSLVIEAFGTVLKDWFAFLQQQCDLPLENQVEFLSVLQEVLPEAVRVTKAAHLLLHYVRLGAGVSPRLRGKRFSDFIEGHARVVRIDKQDKGCELWLGFDNQDKDDDNALGPVRLPKEMCEFLVPGDVMDIELGYRGDQWTIVDIGPVYPATVYMEADLLDMPEKIT